MTNISKSLRALDRDLAAEKAATMIRKGSPAVDVCRAVGISDTALRKMAKDYGFRYPVAPYTSWPAADDPGEAGKQRTAYENWERAVTGAASTLASFSTGLSPLSTQPTDGG
jgi:hypothetical protein